MQATATAAYYAELVQTNQALAAGGMTAIAIVSLEWGPLVQQGATGAQVTTFETRRTTYSDGSTDQARDRNVYALVHEGGVWKIQSDDHPDASANQPGQGAPGSGGAGTAPLPATPFGPGQSSNWAGYAASGGNFTAVSGTWTVPQVAATSTAGADASWVGIGGERAHDLIQAGTQATVAGGWVRYAAWVELLPQAAQAVLLVVGPGDRITVAIGEQTVGTWLIIIQNQTTGQQYQVTETYASTHSSAEWIEEARSSGRRVVPLDDFGTVHFAAADATMDGRQVSIAQANGSAITLVDRRGQALARPSALGADGASFSVVHAAVVPMPATPAPPGGRMPPATMAGTLLARRGG